MFINIESLQKDCRFKFDKKQRTWRHFSFMLKIKNKKNLIIFDGCKQVVLENGFQVEIPDKELEDIAKMKAHHKELKIEFTNKIYLERFHGILIEVYPDNYKITGYEKYSKERPLDHFYKCAIDIYKKNLELQIKS